METLVSQYIIPIITSVAASLVIFGGNKLYTFIRHQKRARLEYWDADEVNSYKKYYIETQCQDFSPANFDEPGESFGRLNRVNLIDFFLKDAFSSNSSKFYLVLGDSGMGKTTFLVNLFLRYRNKPRVYKRDIYLIPFGIGNVEETIQKLVENKRPEDSILLLDAFDEDKAALENSERLYEILKITKRFFKVVITCRTHFFANLSDEPHTTGIHKLGGNREEYHFVKKYVSPFSDEEIKKFIRKRFKIYEYKKRKAAFKLVKKVPNLMVRPMMLNYIDALMGMDREFDSVYEVYSALVDNWIARESNRYEADRRRDIRVQLNQFSKEIARFIYLNKTDLFHISASDMAVFAERFSVDLSLLEMKSKSLLNRNNAGMYKFAHKSIFEFFLASNLVDSEDLYAEMNFEGLDQCRTFYLYLHGSRTLGVSKYQKEIKQIYVNFDNIKYYDGLDDSRNENYGGLYVEAINDALYMAFDKNGREWHEGDLRNIECFYNLVLLRIGPRNLKRIKSLSLHNLKYLYLQDNLIDYIGNLYLPSIEEINISSNKLTNLSAFHNLRTLKKIFIQRTNIETSEIRKFANALPNCQIIDASAMRGTPRT